MTTEAITVFDGERAWLSNFYPAPFDWSGVVDGVQIAPEGEYVSGEHAFQAAKFLDGDHQRRIMEAETPAQAKALGGDRGHPIHLDWETRLSLLTMQSVTKAKFDRPVRQQRLGETGDALLVEGNRWHDQKWGQCSCDKHAASFGRNLLGLVLMEHRAKLRGEDATRWPRVALTGHRNFDSASDERWATEQLVRIVGKLRAQYGTTTLISGMALGADMFWAETALASKLKLWAYLPGSWQAERWSGAQMDRYRDLLDQAARVFVLPGDYHVSKLHVRSQLMVRDSDALVAVLNSNADRGGTLAAFRWASDRGRTIIHVDPHLRKVNFINPPKERP